MFNVCALQSLCYLPGCKSILICAFLVHISFPYSIMVASRHFVQRARNHNGRSEPDRSAQALNIMKIITSQIPTHFIAYSYIRFAPQ